MLTTKLGFYVHSINAFCLFTTAVNAAPEFTWSQCGNTTYIKVQVSCDVIAKHSNAGLVVAFSFQNVILTPPRAVSRKIINAIIKGNEIVTKIVITNWSATVSIIDVCSFVLSRIRRATITLWRNTFSRTCFVSVLSHFVRYRLISQSPHSQTSIEAHPPKTPVQ